MISGNEAHGTGTPLGDPIETGSLSAAVLAEQRPGDAVVCASIKANLGHGESTAGVSGLLRLALGLAHGETPPNAQLRALNPHVRSATRGKPSVMPCHVTRGSMALDAQQNRSGGVSSFGYSGTIAHALLGSLQAADAAGRGVVGGKGAPPRPPLAYRRHVLTWQAGDTLPSSDERPEVTALLSRSAPATLALIDDLFIDADMPLMQAGR